MINIDDYKPFLIRKMQGRHDAVDSKEEWGMIVKSVPFNLLPEAKEPYKNDWKDEDGDEEYVGELKFKAYTMNVSFAVIADSDEDANAQIRAFFDYIRDGEFEIYDTYTHIGRQHVRYAGYENKTFKRRTDKTVVVFEVKFKVNDPVTEVEDMPPFFYGVGIQHKDGYVYTKQQWTDYGLSSNDAVGVVVADTERAIVIYKKLKDGTPSILEWSNNITTKIDLGGKPVTATDVSYALKDFAGKANTDAIMLAISRGLIADAPIAQWCRSLGDKWYLPAVGEWQFIIDNKTEVNACLGLIGGNEISSSLWYWLSTQVSKTDAWTYMQSGNYESGQKNFSGWGRAISQTDGKKAAGGEPKSMSIRGLDNIGIGIGEDFEIVCVPRNAIVMSNLTVSCSDTDVEIGGLTVLGFSVTVNRGGAERDIELTVSCSTSKGTLTASKTVHAKVMTSFEGARIQHTNGTLYTVRGWLGGGYAVSAAYGVAIADGTHSMILNKNEGAALKWSSDNVLVEGCVAGDSSVAKQDFLGEINTDAIMAAIGHTISDAPAAQWCRALGADWYMPAEGENMKIFEVFDSVNDCLFVIDGTLLSNNDCWASTQTSEKSLAWYYKRNESISPVNSWLKGAEKHIRSLSKQLPFTPTSFTIHAPSKISAFRGNGERTYRILLTPDGASDYQQLQATCSTTGVTCTVLSKSLFKVSVVGFSTSSTITVSLKVKLNNGSYLTKDIEINVEYTAIYNGVGIQHTNGTIYTKEEWVIGGFSSSDAKGVAIGDGVNHFLLNKTNGFTKFSNNVTDLIPGILTTDNESEAGNDFESKENTDAIISAKTTISGFDCPAADWCRALTEGSLEWDLPAGGEVLMMLNKKIEVNACRTLIGGSALPTYSIFSSTQYTDPSYFWSGKIILSPLLSKDIRNISEGVVATAYLFDVVPTSFDVPSPAKIITYFGTGENTYTITTTPAEARTYQELQASCSVSGVVCTVLNKKKFKVSVTGFTSPSSNVTINLKLILNNGSILTKDITIEVQYSTIYIGVGIKHINGNIYTASQWQDGGYESTDALGVVIGDGTHDLLLHKSSERKMWSGQAVDISGITKTTDILLANNDFAGKQNTNALTSSGLAVHAANWVKDTLGTNWWLPSGGEVLLIMSKRIKANECLSLISGDAITQMWTSTQYSNGRAWRCQGNGVLSDWDRAYSYETRGVTNVIE